MPKISQPSSAVAEGRVVVADAGPLIALSIVNEVELLRGLFGAVLIPAAVRDELERGRPRPGWNLLATFPWIDLRSPATAVERLLAQELDQGEAEAIALALELPGSMLLLDDLRARRLAAQAYGLDVVGTLGVLVRARRASIVGPLRPILDSLSSAGIFISPALVDVTLRSVGE